LPMWLALKHDERMNAFGNGELSFSKMLVDKGANVDDTDDDGNTLLQHCTLNRMENAALFLIREARANINLLNQFNESALHTACEIGLVDLVECLLLNGANANVQTSSSISRSTMDVHGQTPMHKVIANGHEHLIDLFVKHKDLCKCNFDLVDSARDTVLSLALFNNLFDVAHTLITNKCSNINSRCVDIDTDDEHTLLHQAIMRQNTDAALFLIRNKIDVNVRTKHGLSCIQLAVKRHLPLVVEHLCAHGASMTDLDEKGDTPLWNALETGQEDIASILVVNGADTTHWAPTGPDNCLQTLLHRAIDENNESVAVFLIKSRTDINSPRRPGKNDETPDEAKDGMSPLHLACFWGLERVVVALVDHIDCELNKTDSDGNTPLHLAIINENQKIAKMLINQTKTDLNGKNKAGQSPFAIALMKKNNGIARDLLMREPNAAEQFDNKGRNFLHQAVLNSDIETVLMLLTLNVNVNSKTHDAQSKTALHIAVEVGDEMILRNLLLANANINDLTNQKKNAMHLLAELHKMSKAGTIALILLENNINANAVDNGLNNPLHIAVQYGNLDVVKTLLDHATDMDKYALNSKGCGPLHLLGLYSKENSNEIIEHFASTIENLNLNHKDSKGNTCLLLAYQSGNGHLCRTLVKYGAALGAYNDDGLSIFNYPVATKQLLYKLLEILTKEPPWVECDVCMECRQKFTITVRKHHCRHCGRVLCKKCSEKEISILKFGIQRPTRVCNLCFDVLTANSEQFK
jgi:ankyrin repeat protein